MNVVKILYIPLFVKRQWLLVLYHECWLFAEEDFASLTLDSDEGMLESHEKESRKVTKRSTTSGGKKRKTSVPKKKAIPKKRVCPTKRQSAATWTALVQNSLFNHINRGMLMLNDWWLNVDCLIYISYGLFTPCATSRVADWFVVLRSYFCDASSKVQFENCRNQFIAVRLGDGEASRLYFVGYLRIMTASKCTAAFFRSTVPVSFATKTSTICFTSCV